MKFIIWADGREREAVVVDVPGMPDAVETGANKFDVLADEVNVIEADMLGAAEFYGVAHALADWWREHCDRTD